jgi:hypothetical protein
MEEKLHASREALNKTDQEEISMEESHKKNSQ